MDRCGRGCRKCHTLTIFTCVNGNHMTNRHDYLARHTAKAGLELDKVIAQVKRTGCIYTHVKNDFTIFDELHRHFDRSVDLHRNIG